MQKLFDSFARLCVSTAFTSTASNRLLAATSNVPSSFLNVWTTSTLQTQQTRFMHKDSYKEPGWKPIGYKWMIQFPADGKNTMKKLTLHKLGGRDPVTGNTNMSCIQHLYYSFVYILFLLQAELSSKRLVEGIRKGTDGLITADMDPRRDLHWLKRL